MSKSEVIELTGRCSFLTDNRCHSHHLKNEIANHSRSANAHTNQWWYLCQLEKSRGRERKKKGELNFIRSPHSISPTATSKWLRAHITVHDFCLFLHHRRYTSQFTERHHTSAHTDETIVSQSLNLNWRYWLPVAQVEEAEKKYQHARDMQTHSPSVPYDHTRPNLRQRGTRDSVPPISE